VTEKKAKKWLRRMLDSFTPGSVLALLAELFHADAQEAQQEGDPTAEEQCRQAEATLIVVGLGIDAIRPR
jgi:hypothetical protein